MFRDASCNVLKMGGKKEDISAYQSTAGFIDSWLPIKISEIRSINTSLNLVIGDHPHSRDRIPNVDIELFPPVWT